MQVVGIDVLGGAELGVISEYFRRGVNVEKRENKVNY